MVVRWCKVILHTILHEMGLLVEAYCVDLEPNVVAVLEMSIFVMLRCERILIHD